MAESNIQDISICKITIDTHGARKSSILKLVDRYRKIYPGILFGNENEIIHLTGPNTKVYAVKTKLENSIAGSKSGPGVKRKLETGETKGNSASYEKSSASVESAVNKECLVVKNKAKKILKSGASNKQAKSDSGTSKTNIKKTISWKDTSELEKSHAQTDVNVVPSSKGFQTVVLGMNQSDVKSETIGKPVTIDAKGVSKQKIRNLVERYSTIYPDISFRIEDEIVYLSGANTKVHAIKANFEKSIAVKKADLGVKRERDDLTPTRVHSHINESKGKATKAARLGSKIHGLSLTSKPDALCSPAGTNILKVRPTKQTQTIGKNIAPSSTPVSGLGHSPIRAPIPPSTKVCQQPVGHIPAHWVDMAETQTERRVTLEPSSEEFKNVARELNNTSENEITAITKIQRIQIPQLYRKYQVSKEEMKCHLSRTDIERRMWHEIDSIGTKSVTGRYSGQNATVNMRGVYCSDASYASRFAPKDDSGSRYMYLCNVLTGDYTQGDPSMTVSPVKEGSARYDSVVDDVWRPRKFFIFSDHQAYPLYIIYFRLKRDIEHMDCNM